MGGDYGLPVVVPAVINVLKKNPKVRFILTGNQKLIEETYAKELAQCDQRIDIVHCSEMVAMDELPSVALRTKKDSSMRVAIDMVKKGVADACVSAGNTGALMATSRFVLKTIPGIDRPAILARMPTYHGFVRVIDLGANVESWAEHLFQFAVMGCAICHAVDGIASPRIGLLNVGVEEIKGNEHVKQASQLLQNCGLLNYTGYVEGDGIFSGNVDLVVCDGFVGNIALKSTEGVARMILSHIKAGFSQNLYTRLLGLLVKPVLGQLKNQFNPAKYNGASFVGLNGIVIKSHGGASQEAFECALLEAIAQVDVNIVKLLQNNIQQFVEEGLLL